MNGLEKIRRGLRYGKPGYTASAALDWSADLLEGETAWRIEYTQQDGTRRPDLDVLVRRLPSGTTFLIERLF